MNGIRWDACTEPEEMLWYLHDLASDRLLRLFACASCRLIWSIIPTPNARRAVVASERFADGLTTPESLRVIETAALRTRPSTIWLAALAAVEAANAYPWQAAQWAPAWAAEAAADAAGRLSLAAFTHGSAVKMADHAWYQERQSQCAVLRDIIGTPMMSHSTPAAWKQWTSGSVASLAQSIYENGRFGDLPQLADALEQAGCADNEVLGHCRSTNPHVRGCWVLDGLLGKRPEPRACTGATEATGDRHRHGGLSYHQLVSKRNAARRFSPILAA